MITAHRLAYEYECEIKAQVASTFGHNVKELSLMVHESTEYISGSYISQRDKIKIGIFVSLRDAKEIYLVEAKIVNEDTLTDFSAYRT